MKTPAILLSRRVRIALAITAIAAVVGAAGAAPRGLRRMDSFRVRRVAVLGTRYLPPHEALSISGITRQSNVFDDFALWQRALEGHPLVASATIRRKLPGTIRIAITEAEPIALIATTALQPITANGELLPIDPSRIDLDLPVVVTRYSILDTPPA